MNSAQFRQYFTFTTQRLHLRPLAVEDEELYRSLYSCSRVMRFIGEPFSNEKCKKTFERILKNQNSDELSQLFLVVNDKQTTEKYGLCALPKLNLANLEAEVGNMLLPAAQCKKIAEEATMSVVNKLDELGIKKIYMHIEPKNKAAIKGAERIKFLPSKTEENIYLYKFDLSQ